MAVRQIQNRILLKLAVASLVAIVIILAVALEIARDRTQRVVEREDKLIAERVLSLAESPRRETALRAFEASLSTWSGEPALVVLEGSRELLLGGGGSVWGNEDGIVSDEVLRRGVRAVLESEAGDWRIAAADGEFQFLAKKPDGGEGWAVAIVGRELSLGWLREFRRLKVGIALGGCVFLALGFYTYREHRKRVFEPLSQLVVEIERRIKSTSGECLELDGKGDEIEVLTVRYNELVSLVDSQKNALVKSGEELRQLLDTLPAYVWYKDDKNNILRVNKSGAESVGMSIEELEGKAVKDVFPAEAEEYYKDDLEVIRSGEAKLGYIESYSPENGPERTIRTDKIPYKDAEGRVTGVVALVTDITELVDLQEASEASERLMKRLLEIGNWEATNFEERILAALKDTCEVLGMKTGIFSKIEGGTYRIEQVFDTTGAFKEGEEFPLEDVYCSIVVKSGGSIATNQMGSTSWSELACYKNARLESYIAAPIRLGGKIVGTLNFSAPEPRRKPFSQFEVNSVRMMARWVEGLTRRERMLNQLNRQKKEFQTLVEAAPIGLVIVGGDRRVQLMNTEAERIFGYKRDEVIGRSFEYFLEDEQKAALRGLLTSEKGRRLELQFGSDGGLLAKRRDRRVVPIEVVFKFLDLVSGPGAMASVSDISSRLAEQQALKDSQERFQLAAQGASVGIWDWYDIEGQKAWWSPKYYELIGYEPDEIESSLETFEGLLHPEDKERTLERAQAVLKEGGGFSMDYRLRCKDGRFRWFSGCGIVLHDEDGEVSRVTGSIQDIDDRKRVEEELSERVGELRAANEELSNFAYLSSHDLQEPLRTISSFIGLLKDEYGPKLDETANEYMDFTVVGVTRLQNMIRSLLRYTRLSSKLKTSAEFALREAVEMARVDLKSRIEETGTVFVVEEELPRLNGDVNQVSLVLQNLFSNAIKFNRSARPSIEVTASRRAAGELGSEDAKPGHYIVVSVKDNGIGIREPYQKRIFSIFQRLHPSGEYEGNGIGLSMVQKIMQSHGGCVWVDSIEGVGSTFHLAFPIRC